jgi:hypothetical protein
VLVVVLLPVLVRLVVPAPLVGAVRLAAPVLVAVVLLRMCHDGSMPRSPLATPAHKYTLLATVSE